MFQINGHYWQIELVPSNSHHLLTEDGQYALGVCDKSEGTIYINELLNSNLFKRVLSHEITHAAMFSYNIILDYAQEELIAEIISLYGEQIIAITNEIFSKLLH